MTVVGLDGAAPHSVPEGSVCRVDGAGPGLLSAATAPLVD